MHTLWPAVAAATKQATEDAWLQDLFNQYCWRGATVITAPAQTGIPPPTPLTAADFVARDSRAIFAPELPNRLTDKNVQFTNGQMLQEDCHEIRTAFNLNAHGNPTVLTNHVLISSVPDEFWKYDVQYQPPLPATTTGKKKRVLLETMINRMAFLSQHGPRQPHNPVLFTHDNHSTIFATQDLQPLAALALEDHVVLGDPPHTNTWSAQTFIPSARSGAGSGNGVITIGLRGQRGPANVDLRPFRQMVLGDILYEHQHVSNIAQVLNTLVADSACVPKTLPEFDTFQIGANKFFLRSGFAHLANTNVLQLHHGFSVTVKPAMGSTLLNFNSATSAFYCPLNVAAYLRQVASPILDKPLAGLQGLRVYIEYNRGQALPGGALPDIDRLERRIKTIFGIGDPHGGQKLGTAGFVPTNKPGLAGWTSVWTYLNHCQ